MNVIAYIVESIKIVGLILEIFGPVINLVIALCALGALIIAVISLRETAKARRDMFLPLITVLGISKTGAAGTIKIRNMGHGAALNIRAHLTGADPFEIASECPPSYEIEKQKKLILPEVQSISNPQLVISYYDVFSRQIQTVYNVKLMPDTDGHFTVRIQDWSREVVLP